MENLYIINLKNCLKIDVPSATPSPTFITINDQKIESSLTREINKHLNNLKNVSIDSFNWEYYVKKYDDLKILTSQKNAWEHWKSRGLKECRNPIDNKTICQTIDVNYLLAMMTILTQAINLNLKKISILNLTHNQPLNQEIIQKNLQIERTHPIIIFENNNLPYLYHLDESMYKDILIEISYFIQTFDQTIRQFEKSVNRIQMTHLNEKKQKNHIFRDKSTFEIDSNELTKSIRKIKYEYFKTEYEKFLNSHKLRSSQTLCLQQMMCKYPFDLIKTKYNNLLNLDFNNYLLLCASIIENSFWNFEKTITTPNQIIFDHNFYLQLYPCYQSIFKNAEQSGQHYIIHGRLEKLIPNEIVFKLIKINQDYLLNYLLNKMPLPQLRDLPPFFYDSQASRYYDANTDTIPKKPLIYILTRTSNRETLFHECCESINQQMFVNVRHIVGYDNEDTKKYVRKYKHIFKSVDLISKKNIIHPNQYIDCLYEQIENSGPGWVMVLDDDDKFLTPYALHHLEKHTQNTNNLLIWMLYRPDKFIYPTDQKNPKVGEIASCCYLYHTSKISKGHWGGNAIGDFDFFKILFDKTTEQDHIYINYPLTGVNYKEKISGWTAM